MSFNDAQTEAHVLNIKEILTSTPWRTHEAQGPGGRGLLADPGLRISMTLR